MDIEKCIKIMKILLVLAGILFIFMYMTKKTNDCDMCFEEKKGMENFMKDYSNRCLQVKRGLPNISYYEPSNTNSEYPY